MMDLNTINYTVESCVEKAQLLRSKMTEEKQLGTLDSFIQALQTMKNFLNNERNSSVLLQHNAEPDQELIGSPLDALCKDVMRELDEIAVILKNETEDRLQSDISLFDRGIVNETLRSSISTSLVVERIQESSFTDLLSAFEVLNHLEGHNKTLIIIGPNGSGKTSFANHIKNLDNHVKVIPASKPIRATGYIPSIYNATLKLYNDELYYENSYQEDLLQKLIIGLCSEHDDVARRFLETGVRDKKSTYERIKSLFDSFFDIKLDNSAFSEKQLKARKNNGISYEFNQMSDGERAAFFYIATVIAAPQQSFIVVDEPENHLNPAIYNKIWDSLIKERDDCQFIFISHTMDFISARSNYELVMIKEFEYPNLFEFEFLGSELENLQTDFVVEIVGSRKPILFCEGSKSDYDYKIYERLFGDQYTVIPTGSCTAVENSVEACNMHATTYSLQSAVGIIDSDLKSDDEIDSLKKKRVYSLHCNEIEMLLLDEMIFKKVLSQVFKSDTEFDIFKDAFFDKLSDRKSYIVKRLVKTQIDEKLKSSNIDDKHNKTRDEFKNNLANIFARLNIDELWDECEEKVSDIISNQKYEEALRYCCLEHGEILAGVANRIIKDYAEIALGVLNNDNRLVEAVRNKYFPELAL